MFPLVLDLLRKCWKSRKNAQSRCENAAANHKQQCRLLKVLCNLNQKKKERLSHMETAKSFSLSAYFTFFFATFGNSASSFEETAPDAAPDEEEMALRWTLQPNKNAIISKIKKCHLQLPKSSGKML